MCDERTTPGSRLPTEGDPEGNLTPRSARSAILESNGEYRRISKARRFRMEACIIQERIDGGIVRVVKNVQHGHMPNDLEVFLHVDGLEERDVANVGPVVTKCIPSDVSERRGKHCVCGRRVGNEPYILAGHDCLATGRIDSISTQKSSGCLRAAQTEATGCFSPVTS